jgi:hypothetical protein
LGCSFSDTDSAYLPRWSVQLSQREVNLLYT